MIVGITGRMGSGKDTIGDHLVTKHGFVKLSFADTLKDAVAAIFSWDRQMLSGLTPESRAWREQIDEWWADRLGLPHLTPRWVLQNFGTEVCRQGFHCEIWIASLQRRLMNLGSRNLVITDCRFQNEVDMISSMPNSATISVQRPSSVAVVSQHASEAEIGAEFTIINDGTIPELLEKVDQLLALFYFESAGSQ